MVVETPTRLRTDAQDHPPERADGGLAFGVVRRLRTLITPPFSGITSWKKVFGFGEGRDRLRF
jgi:hypothetical protein